MTDNNEEQIQSGDEATERRSNEGMSNETDHADVLESDLKKLQDERDALFEQVARVQADFRNSQKRLEGEKQQAIQFANAKLIQALLPVIDNFERALEIDPEKTDVASLLKGMRLVYDEILHLLQQQHVEVIAPQPGAPFDPNLHQAVMQQPDDRYTDPTVTQLMQKGYAVHGRMLRPAAVAVSATI